jgi:hypothetical protein
MEAPKRAQSNIARVEPKRVTPLTENEAPRRAKLARESEELKVTAPFKFIPAARFVNPLTDIVEPSMAKSKIDIADPILA